MWYVNTNNQQSGPFDERDIAVGLAQGHYNAGTMVWCDGLPSWIQIGQSELAKYLPRRPPPLMMPQTQATSVSQRSRIMGGIGLLWGSIALVNGLVNGLSSFIGLLFSVLMILVGGYYFFGRPARHMMVLASSIIAGIIFLILLSLAPSKTRQKEQVLPVVGETFRTGKFEITVTRADQRASVGTDFFVQNPSSGAIYVALQLTYKNISNKPINFFSLPSISLISPDGQKYSADLGASSSFATELDLDEKILSDLNPGILVRSASVFEIGSDRFSKDTWRIAVDADQDVVIQFLPKTSNLPVITPASRAFEKIELCMTSDVRIPIPMWKPTFIKGDDVAKLEKFDDQQLVYVEFSASNTSQFGSKAEFFCTDTQEYSFSFENNNNKDDFPGGYEIGIKGNSQVQNNRCLFSGLYIYDYIPGMHQGWYSAQLNATTAQKASRKTHCLKALN